MGPCRQAERRAAWRSDSPPSLPEVHASVALGGRSFWRRLFAFSGPGYLVAVGYMDPGNWATDIAGGSRFGYTPLSVILLSKLMAILFQALAVRLGVATGRDLAQACRDHYPRPIALERDDFRFGCILRCRSSFGIRPR